MAKLKDSQQFPIAFLKPKDLPKLLFTLSNSFQYRFSVMKTTRKNIEVKYLCNKNR